MNKLTLNHVAEWIPKRQSDSYKSDYGKILLVGGDKDMGGAIIMSSLASLNSGAGLITTATAEENRSSLHSHAPEVMFTDMYDEEGLSQMIQGMDTILIGPGLGRGSRSKEVFLNVLQNISDDQILIIDGDAIHLYVNELDYPKINATSIFTPHLGEWKTLTGLSADKENVEDNMNYQGKLDSVIVLKKDRTQIYLKDEVWENTTGNPGMSTGGTGDTLAGMIAGFSKQFKDLDQAVLSAVFLHSYIADKIYQDHYLVRPTKISEKIPKTMKNIETMNEKE